VPKPQTPVIRNVSDIKGRVKGLEFVHFTDAQWAKATKDVPAGTSLPKHGLVIETHKSQHGGVLLMARCSGGPGQICVTQLVFKDGRYQYQCSCTPVGGTSPPPSTCNVAIIRTPFPHLGCQQGNCGGTCRLEIVTSGVRIFIVCRCA